MNNNNNGNYNTGANNTFYCLECILRCKNMVTGTVVFVVTQLTFCFRCYSVANEDFHAECIHKTATYLDSRLFRNSAYDGLVLKYGILQSSFVGHSGSISGTLLQSAPSYIMRGRRAAVEG